MSRKYLGPKNPLKDFLTSTVAPLRERLPIRCHCGRTAQLIEKLTLNHVPNNDRLRHEIAKCERHQKTGDAVSVGYLVV